VNIRFVTRPPYAISPTGAQSFLDCPRQWALRYLCKIRQPPTEATELGSKTHDLVDNVYKNNQPISDGSKAAQMAKELITVLPPPNSWIFSESVYYIEVEHKESKVFFTARIDLLDFAQNIVFDHKTTGNFKWAKTPITLQSDLQAIVYSVIAKLLGMENPSVQWSYVIKTGKPRTQLVRTAIENLRLKWQKIVELGQYLTYLRYNVLDYRDYPQQVTACDNYGGCYYLEKYCTIGARDRIISMWKYNNRRK
jgi:hypothetical protein